MNNSYLTYHILRHILANLGVVSGDYVSWSQSRSLVDKSFLLKETLDFEIDNKIQKHPIYCCQSQLPGNQNLTIMLANCTHNLQVPEFVCLTQLQNSPAFAFYFVEEEVPAEDLWLATTVDYKNWLPCTTYLQATYLAGMEQVRDLIFGWKLPTDYQAQYKLLLSFIQYHEQIFSVSDIEVK